MRVEHTSVPRELFRALFGVNSSYGCWELREGETITDRTRLIKFLYNPSAKTELLNFLRGNPVPRGLANKLLEAFEIPTSIPVGAMNVLGLGEKRSNFNILPRANHTKGGSPLDWPEVFWDNPGYGEYWFWRRNDWPIAAVQLADGSWVRQTATY